MLEAQIAELANNSSLSHVNWHGRGHAPLGYLKGMAIAWSRVYRQWQLGQPAAMLMAMANTHQSHDALSHYDGTFISHDMPNNVSGADTLRHLFVLLMGLGMRESSGRFCEGRDRSASNVTSDTAEAGLFQMSWNAHVSSREIPSLVVKYTHEPDTLAHIFHEGVQCSEADLHSFGVGEGLIFQNLCKSSPLCAIMTAGVGLRVIRTHWGPINRREAEIRPEANKLFIAIQSMLDNQVIALSEP